MLNWEKKEKKKQKKIPLISSSQYDNPFKEYPVRVRVCVCVFHLNFDTLAGKTTLILQCTIPNHMEYSFLLLSI